MIRWIAAMLVMAVPLWAEPLRIGTESDYRPYIFLDEAGQRDGFDVDLADMICDRGGFECHWIEVPFDQLFTGVAAARFDIAIGGIGSAPDRDRLVDWTRIYREVEEAEGGFAGLSQDIDPTRARISVLTASTQMNVLIARGYAPIPYPSNKAALEALFAGEVDLFFGSRLYLAQLVEAGEDRLLDLGTLSYADNGTRIAVRKDRPDLRMRLDTILDVLEDNGSLALIGAKWFPETEQRDL